MENCINVLPEELLINIFSYLSIHDITTSIQDVCQLWTEVSKDPELWKQKKYVVENQSDTVISQFLQTLPHLQVLLLNRPVSQKILKQVYVNCNFLSVLKINCYQYLPSITFNEITLNCSNISNLLLPSNYLKDHSILNSITNLVHLRTLQSKQFWNPRYVISLKSIADSCNKLEDLHLQGIDFESHDILNFLQKKRLSSILLQNQVHILDLLKINVESLRKVEIDLNKCDTGNNTSKLRCLKSLIHLQILVLRRIPNTICNIIPEIFQSHTLCKLLTLKFLECGDIVNDTGLQTICANCCLLQELTIEIETEIELTNNSLDYLFSLENLAKLTVSKNFGLAKYSALKIVRCKHLQILCLKESKVADFLEDLFLQEWKMNIKSFIFINCTFENFRCNNVIIKLPNMTNLNINYCQSFDDNLLNKFKTWFPSSKIIVV